MTGVAAALFAVIAAHTVRINISSYGVGRHLHGVSKLLLARDFCGGFLVHSDGQKVESA